MKFKFIILCIISFLCMETLNAQSSEKDIDNNLVEMSLLNIYEDVIFDKIIGCYYIFDSIGNTGIANADGEVLISPINGNMSIRGSYRNFYIILGDETDEFKRPVEFATNANNIILGNMAITQGLFKAVVKQNKSSDNEINAIIQNNKYDYISIVSTADNVLNIKGFCVGKKDEDKNVLWGFCDEDGNEIIPCEYTGVFYDGETFSGDNSRDKFEWNENTFNKEYVNNDMEDNGETKTYKIGDYYNEDGKQGVVFEVSKDGRHGKILSLDCTKTRWNAHKVKGCEYKGNSKTGANDLNNGKKNADIILAREDAGLYLAFLWCREKGDDWYLPSQNELRKIYEMKDMLNETIEREGAERLSSGIVYFSSTEYPYETEKTSAKLNFTAGVRMDNGFYCKVAKNDIGIVRAVATF